MVVPRNTRLLNLEAIVKLRKHSRFAVQLPAVYTAENIQSKGVVFNLSAEGCAIRSSKIMPKGAYLRCRSLFFG